MKTFFLYLVFPIFFLPIVTFADNYPTGAKSAGMSNSTVAVSDIWSVHHNQAGLAYINKYTAAVYFSSAFLIKELGLKAAAIAVPVRGGTFGLSLSYFGYSKYNESKVGLAYARNFADIVSVGIQLDYFNYNIGNSYGNSGSAVAEIGILTKPIKNLFIGAHVFNPTRSKIKDYDSEILPTIFRLGIGYYFSDNFLMTIETEKTLDYKAVFKSGIEYKIFNRISLWSGVATNPVTYSFGAGFSFKYLNMNIAFANHQYLGITPHVSIVLNL